MSLPIVEILMFPARSGDAFLVTLRDGSLEKHYIIDLGFEDTYSQYIEPRLLAIAEKGGKIERLIITHIDSDHIRGGLEFLKKNKSSSEPEIIAVEQVWHNSYRHIQEVEGSTPASTLNGHEIQELNNIVKKSGEPSEKNEEEKDVSGKEGSIFAGYLRKYSYQWNTDFNGEAISRSKFPEIQPMPSEKMILLSPSNRELIKLERKWRRELRSLGFTHLVSNEILFDDAFECQFRFIDDALENEDEAETSASIPDIKELVKEPFEDDKSPTNCSSIAFIIEFKDRKLLFLGDACSSQILESLEECYPDKSGPILFDVVKVSHHGSKKNTSSNLLEKIASQCFLVSTNGESHHHPDAQTLARIINSNSDMQKSLVFNYPLASELQFLNTPENQRTYNYSFHAPLVGSIALVKIFEDGYQEITYE